VRTNHSTVFSHMIPEVCDYGENSKLCSCMHAVTVEMDYQDNFPYGHPYQFARGPGAVPYVMSSSQITPLVDLTANTCTFGPCISSSVGPGGAGRSSAGVGIAVNITPPGSVEVS